MKTGPDPKLIRADIVDNSVVVEFKDDPEVALFPAKMLHSARNLGKIMHGQVDPPVQGKKKYAKFTPKARVSKRFIN